MGGVRRVRAARRNEERNAKKNNRKIESIEWRMGPKNNTEMKKEEISRRNSLSRSRSLALTRRTCNRQHSPQPDPSVFYSIALFVPRPSPRRSPALFGPFHPPIPHHTHEATKPLQLHEVNLLCSALLFHFRTHTFHPTPASHRNTKSIPPFGPR